MNGSGVRAVITWQPTTVYGGTAPVEDHGYAEVAAQVLAEAVHKALVRHDRDGALEWWITAWATGPRSLPGGRCHAA